jgi:cell division protein FtsA
MKPSEYVAALDIGTSKMIAVAAQKNESGSLSILASEKIESGNCIRRGCIYNIDETGKKIEALIADLSNSLERKSNNPLGKIYVGIGGQSLRSELYKVSKQINGVITREIINSFQETCRQYDPVVAKVLAIVPSEYDLDGKLETNPPIGAFCSKMEAKFQLILGRHSLETSLRNIEERGKMKIAGFFISPLATAEVVLTDKEKELGCALIEFGAGITYISVYKNKLLRFLIAIPIGGDVITKDICTLKVSEKDAEELKINYGSAILDGTKNEKIKVKSDDSYISHQEIELKDLNDVIEARSDEIIANINEQLKQSGYASELNSGIVITGGATALRNLRESLQKKTGKEVRLASIKKTLVMAPDEMTCQQGNATVIGLLALGRENCAKEEPPKIGEPETEEIKPIPGKTDIFGNPLHTPRKPRDHTAHPTKQEAKTKETAPKRGIIERLTNSIFGEDGNS